MNIKIGIDTGGTYTDAAVICYDTRQVVREAKALTTRENLAVGITKVIENLKIKETDNVCLVCLSTTLATNAIMEGYKSSVGLITVGASVQDKIPTSYQAEIKGKIGIDGCEEYPLDESEIVETLNRMKGRVEALAISGYASVRNPIHEIEIKKQAAKILGVPIVCAHELTRTLGYYERTVTSVLNAHLMPIVKELIVATKAVLKQSNIDTQIFIFKGDGHSMSDSFAEERPVETILSGPAASMVGGMFLTECDNAIIADMGGTTTDIVVVIDGVAPSNKKGAIVGDWRTSANTVQVNTFGLGGDSHIRINPFGGLTFGPERVVPLCFAAYENPTLYDEIDSCRKEGSYRIVKQQETDCYQLYKKENIDRGELTRQDMQIVRMLENGSHSILYLSRKIGKDIDNLGMQNLLYTDIVRKISMTPTDLLHVTGEYRQWNEKASVLGAELFAKRLNTNPRDFVVQAENQFTYRICLALLQSVCRLDGFEFDMMHNDKAMYFINNALDKTKKRPLDFSLRCTLPIIGLGRPAKVWFTKAAKELGTELILPDYNAVGSAVGAAVGGMQEIFEALIRFNPHADRFIAHTPKNRMLFETLEEAKRFAKDELSQCAKNLIQKLNVKGCEVSITEKNSHLGSSGNDDDCKYIETHLAAEISIPDCKNPSIGAK